MKEGEMRWKGRKRREEGAGHRESGGKEGAGESGQEDGEYE